MSDQTIFRNQIFRAVNLASFVGATALIAMAFSGPLAPAALAHEDDHTPASHHAHDTTNIWDVARGGQLYDNWMAVLEADQPGQTHPAYPPTAKKKGPATWRCKECHGWDYKGASGAYASGSHFTGITGLRGVAGMAPEKIHAKIMDGTHGFTKLTMPHSAMEKIALFLSVGQVDTDRYIDAKTKVARGNPRRGAQFYQTICAVCHGFDGKEINFKDEKKPEFVGTVAVKNPWEALHKIRFGQPGVGMVALIVLDIEDIVDILAYTQTLPVK
jgi:thiosulfate dehydrogenase